MRITMRTWAMLVVSITLVEAHTSFTTLFVNGASQGAGTCVRMNTDHSKTTFPIADIESDDITCGFNGLKAVERTCPIEAGDTVSFRYEDWPGSNRYTSIVEGHSGPCAVYMKQMSTDGPRSDGSFPSNSPAGDGWFKIMYDDRDQKNEWCTDRLNHSSNGVVSVKIPADVKSGYYLLRPELLALHAATQRDPQFYTGCAQVYISGGSGTATPETTSIPGYVKYDDAAMKYNIYSTKSGPYPEFGPKRYIHLAANKRNDEVSDKVASRPRESLARFNRRRSQCGPSDTSTDKGISTETQRPAANRDLFACPAGTILELGNMCLPEAPHYKDTDDSMQECWAASKKCWETADVCWKNATPAISYEKGHGCYLMNDRCDEISNACKAMKREGPPNEGKSLTPEKTTLGGWGIMAKRDDYDTTARAVPSPGTLTVRNFVS